nr:hypothetical protein [Tanacetum cinerariifolium]
MSSMGELKFFLGLQVKQKPDGIFINQDKYVAEILRKFGLTDGKSTSTPIDTKKPLLKDPNGEDMDMHTYRSMIGSLMYLTSSRPDILFAVCAYSDYAGASLDRKSTIEGCQFLKCRLISWQCKKQTTVATSSTKAEYVAAARCCAQVLWIHNQLIDNGLNFFGKDSSNPLIADNLPKIVWYSTHHVALMKSWLVQKQTTLESVDYLPNEEIFIELSRMGYEKRSTKLTFYKAFFSPQWKFLIHTILQYTPLFEGMIMSHQDDDVVDEGDASVAIIDVPAAADEPSITSPTPTTQPPPPSQDLPSTSQVQPTPPPSQVDQPPSPQQQPQPPQSSHDAEILMDLLHTLLEACTTLTRRVKHLEIDTFDDTAIDDVSNQGRIIASMDADVDVTLKDVADITKEVVVDAEIEASADDDELEPSEHKEVVKVVTTTKLMTKVVTAASATITVADTLIIAAPSAARMRKGVVIRDHEETATPSIIIHSEAKSKEKGKEILDGVIDQVQRKEKEDNAMMRYQALKRKLQTEAQARKNMMIYLRNMVGFKMDYFKGMIYDDIHPNFEKKFNSNVALLEKTREQIEEQDSKALKRTSESQAKKAVKKQKLDEEVEELKRHL